MGLLKKLTSKLKTLDPYYTAAPVISFVFLSGVFVQVTKGAISGCLIAALVTHYLIPKLIKLDQSNI